MTTWTPLPTWRDTSPGTLTATGTDTHTGLENWILEVILVESLQNYFSTIGIKHQNRVCFECCLVDTMSIKKKDF